MKLHQKYYKLHTWLEKLYINYNEVLLTTYKLHKKESDYMNAAIDLGTTFIKLHNGEKFPSGVSKKVYDMATTVMTIDNMSYTMELFNNYDANSNKSLNKNVKLNYLLALHKVTQGTLGIYKNVIVPLPAKQWDNEESVQMYKNLLTLDNSIDITVNGVTKEIFVDNVGIVPEDFYAYYTEEVNNERFNGNRTLLLGIGSWNSNQYLIENDNIIKSNSNEMGCLKVFVEVAETVNAKYNSDIKVVEVYKTLTEGLSYEGKIIDIKPLVKDILMQYCSDYYQDIKNKFSVKTIPYVICIGGGSIVLSEYLREYIPHLDLINNAQNVAVKGMKYMIGDCA
jgi:hypothetical protein